VEIDTTPPSPVGSVSVEISSDVTPGVDHVTVMDTEQVELVTAKGTKLNPQKWVKKCESQIGELNKLKLKVNVLYDGIGKEAYMTEAVGFIAADSVSVARARWRLFGWTTNGLIPLGMGT